MATTKTDPNLMPVPTDPSEVPDLPVVNLFEVPDDMFKNARVTKVVPMKNGGYMMITNVIVAAPPTLCKFGGTAATRGDKDAVSRASYEVDAKGARPSLTSVKDQAYAFAEKVWYVAFKDKDLATLTPDQVHEFISKRGEEFAKFASLAARTKVPWPRVRFKGGYGCRMERKVAGVFKNVVNPSLEKIVLPESTVMTVARLEIHVTTSALRLIATASLIRAEGGGGGAPATVAAPSWEAVSALGDAFSGFAHPTEEGNVDMDDEEATPAVDTGSVF